MICCHFRKTLPLLLPTNDESAEYQRTHLVNCAQDELRRIYELDITDLRVWICEQRIET